MDLERTPPPAKRARRSPPQAGAEDRLGALDDTFLHAILVRMPLRDAATTAVLSRRWPRVFATLPRLVLDAATFNRRGFPEEGDQPCCEDPRRWMRALRCVLDGRAAPVAAFEIDCRFMGLHSEWFSRVFGHLCGSDGLLELRVDNTNYQECYYALPDALYTCTTLTSLDLYHCRLRGPGRDIKLPVLKSIRLREVVAGDKDIRAFISKCKAIERLEIQNIYRARNLHIHAPFLKELEICSYRTLCISVKKTPPLDMVKLSLLYAYLEDFWSPHDNMDTHNEIDYKKMAEREQKQMDEIHNMKTFLFGLKNTKRLELYLSTEYSKVLNMAKASTLMHLPKNKYLPRLQSLSLTLDHNHEVLATLVSFLLNNSPNLKDLRIIELRHPGSPVPLDAEFWERLIIADGSLYHLSSCTFYTDLPLEGHTCWGICKHWRSHVRAMLGHGPPFLPCVLHC